MDDDFANEVFMIIGGAGSLGRRLVEELVDPKSSTKIIRVFDNNENSVARMRVQYPFPQIRWFIGDIRDKERLKLAMNDVTTVIVCAALKHVDLCEYSPFEAIKTNVVGLQNCIEAALESDVNRFLTISSDKAVQACSTYGRCKALGESLTLDANNYKGDRKTIYSVCRPPNYFGSDMSVTDVWQYQKEHDLPLSVTSEKMERYFLDFPDIVRFVLKCVRMMKGGEIFVPSGAQKLKIIDLARQMSDRIEITGMRKGERLTELLMDPDVELPRATLTDGVWVIR